MSNSCYAGAFFLTVTLANASPAQITLYVDQNAVGAADGSSWVDAFQNLRHALWNAQAPGSGVSEIRVAKGTYKPAEVGFQSAAFKLVSGVALRGGFAGSNAVDPDIRNFEIYETVLSGDLAGDDLSGGLNQSENSFHVVTVENTSDDVVLEGFTIQGGNTNIPGPTPLEAGFGGGLSTESFTGILKVSDCAFRENTATFGGGISNWDGIVAELTRCKFVRNRAVQGGGFYGRNATMTDCLFQENTIPSDIGDMIPFGGAAVATTVELNGCTFIGNWNPHVGAVSGAGAAHRCRFVGNSAVDFGGALFGNWTTIENCAFENNEVTGGDGGAINLLSGVLEVSNTSFIGNKARRGGAIFAHNDETTIMNSLFAYNSSSASTLGGGGALLSYCSLTRLSNCSIVGNEAIHGGGVVILNASGEPNVVVELANSILWNNDSVIGFLESAQFYVEGTSQINTHYNVIQGWSGVFGGVGNNANDPMFFDPAGPDGIAGTLDDNFRLSSNSPSINAGDPGFINDPPQADLDGQWRVLCGQVDRGAYEFGIGDFNCDQVFELQDFAAWADCVTGPQSGPHDPGCEAYDFRADVEDRIDLLDFSSLQNSIPSTWP